MIKKRGAFMRKTNFLFNEKIMLNGSHTIEMALIMPMILGTIWCIIYLTFLLYDRNLMEQSTYLAAFRGSKQEEVKTLIEQEVRKEGLELTSGKLLMGKSKMDKMDISLNKTEVTYRYNENLTITREVLHFQPVDYIRNCRKVEKLLDK